MLGNLNYKNPSVDHEKDLQRHTASLMEEKNGVNERVSSGSAMDHSLWSAVQTAERSILKPPLFELLRSSETFSSSTMKNLIK